MKKVVIIQRVLPHYRIPVLKKMRSILLDKGIDLHLIYGQEYPGTVPKTVDLKEPWTFKVRNLYLKTSRWELVWQPCLENINGNDLVIIEQSSRLLINYFLLLRCVTKGAKVAFYGHGKNFQAENPGSFGEIIKKFFITKVDWWFAYTGLSAKIVAGRGFPNNRVTVVNNSIDTDSLAEECNRIQDEDVLRVKNAIGINSENVCVYCGEMYANKRLDFLLEVCISLRKMISDFHIIFIGDGPMKVMISEACRKHDWMHYVGSKYGRERVPYLKAAKALLMPGLVGLVIIDSFVVRVPLITTDIPIHSPEIYYLENNKNGIMTVSDVNAYVEEVANYLRSTKKQAQLQNGCAESAAVYSMDNMVNNFVSGIISCLSSQPSMEIV